MVSGRTKLLGLIGHPIGHSLSPRMHNAAFAADVMEADAAEYVYVAMEVQPDRLSAAVRGLVALGFVGFNVTMPHKEAILPLMVMVDPPARLAGAVNTVSVADEGRLRGLNTDGSGFVEACKEVAVSLEGRRCSGGGGHCNKRYLSRDETGEPFAVARRDTGRREGRVRRCLPRWRGDHVDPACERGRGTHRVLGPDAALPGGAGAEGLDRSGT